MIILKLVIIVMQQHVQLIINVNQILVFLKSVNNVLIQLQLVLICGVMVIHVLMTQIVYHIHVDQVLAHYVIILRLERALIVMVIPVVETLTVSLILVLMVSVTVVIIPN